MSGPAEWTIYESPQGTLTLGAGPSGIERVYFPGQSPHLDPATRRPMAAVVNQLGEYFAAERKAFDLALHLGGSPLQRLVWARLLQIPYGSTISYGELAEGIEVTAFPAGLEPYQRVRSLTGYGGGLERKRALLELEGCAAVRPKLSRKPDQLALI
jgi:methylated-DNA-[protein]-cysteine S-methyltransferase